jgi:hypothetical protein
VIEGLSCFDRYLTDYSLMKKILFSVLLLSLGMGPAWAQRFSMYNTGTLYDSFENPSQAAFIPDSTKNFALSFIGNASIYTYLTGNAQTPIKSRIFLDRENNNAFTAGQNQFNNAFVQSNVYLAMLKMYASSSGRIELGASYQIKTNARGYASDEAVDLINGGNNYTQLVGRNDIFNGHAFYQGFHQLSLTYREKVTRNFMLGIKLSTLLGIDYNKMEIDRSSVTASGTRAIPLVQGTYQATYVDGRYPKRDLLPSLSNPGLAIGIGATYITSGGIILQGNVKDLGFIRWSRRAATYRFDAFNITPTNGNGQDIFRETITQNAQYGAFTKPIVGRAEFAAAKKFVFGSVMYQPTAVVSKQLYGQGTAWALVNQVGFGKFSASLSGIINENKKFDTGLQLMYKKPNFEVFVGSEQLGNSLNVYSAYNDNSNAINSTRSHSGASIYFGFSFKIGKLIERWRNESYYPDGSEQGPLGKRWNDLFNH